MALAKKAEAVTDNVSPSARCARSERPEAQRTSGRPCGDISTGRPSQRGFRELRAVGSGGESGILTHLGLPVDLPQPSAARTPAWLPGVRNGADHEHDAGGQWAD